MAFPHPWDWNLVVARFGDDGAPDFFFGERPEAVTDVPGVVDGAFYWRVEDGHSKDSPGAMPTTMDLAGRNGSTVGFVRFPANSAGKLDAASTTGKDVESGQDGDPAMHASNTIDYDVVLSGKLDVELPGGKVHTLVPGDLLVMAGVPHAWKNHYDEDCIFLVVTIGPNS